jgi:hypothetical protein
MKSPYVYIVYLIDIQKMIKNQQNFLVHKLIGQVQKVKFYF